MIEDLQFVGFYEPDATVAQAVEEEYGIKAFDSAEELIKAVDIIDIVTPTPSHFKIAQQVIEHGKHVFIEKPLTSTIAEGEKLMTLAAEKGVFVQVGHVERFNPAILAIQSFELAPMFIEAHRLATFNPRGTDVSVVLDLMIHDIDIVLSLVKSPLKNVEASGVSIVSPTPDIANARLEFENGCVANITASRISLKQMRKIRLFQSDAYISLDFLEKETQVVRLHEKDHAEKEGLSGFDLSTAKGEKVITVEMPEIEPVNAIKLELESFHQSILTEQVPKVSIEEGFNALKVATQIANQIEKRLEAIQPGA
jgi:Predicted dehydrogenases and related proteins